MEIVFMCEIVTFAVSDFESLEESEKVKVTVFGAKPISYEGKEGSRGARVGC
jgi:hypothetical protein